eukprot:767869-Hanusia_phi.AAC.5
MDERFQSSLSPALTSSLAGKAAPRNYQGAAPGAMNMQPNMPNMPNMMNVMPGPTGFPGVMQGMQQNMNTPHPNMHTPGMSGNRPQAGDMRNFPPVAMAGAPSLPGGMQSNPQGMHGLPMQPNVPQNMMMTPGFVSQARGRERISKK